MESSLILVILVAIILLVITIYCALMSHKLIFFNDAKFRTIFKDSLALIISLNKLYYFKISRNKI